MNAGANLFVGLTRLSLRNPREAARQIMRIGAAFDTGVLWMALVLVAVLSSILTHLAVAMMPMPEQAAAGGLVFSPIRTAVIQLALMAAVVQAMVIVGRWRGGHGTQGQALSLMIWLQTVLLALQLMQIVALMLIPPLADLIGIVAMVLFLVLLTLFVAELHGFRSALSVFFGILATLFVMAFALAILMVLLGISPNV